MKEEYRFEIAGTDAGQTAPLPDRWPELFAPAVEPLEGMAAEAGEVVLEIAPQVALSGPEGAPRTAVPGVTEELLAGAIARSMASLKVYVVESEITQAQERVKAIVRQASY